MTTLPVGVGADADLEVQVGPLHAVFDLAAQVGNLAQQVQRQQDRLDELARNTPGDPTLTAAAISAASGALSIRIGGPQLGRVWQIRRLMVGGTQVTSTVAGTVYVFRAPNDPSNDLATANLIDIASLPMPQPAFYGTHQAILHHGDHVWFYINNPTATTQYVVSMQVEDWAEPMWMADYID